MQTLNRQLKDLEDHTRNLQTAAKEAREALARHLRDGKNLKVAAQAAQDQADKLKDELESLTVQPAALDALEQQLRDTTDAENNAENQFGGAFEELERATTELTSRLNACRKLDKRLEELGEDQSRLERIAADAAKRRGDALLQKNGAVHSVEDAEADLESEEAKKTAQENVVTDWIRQASLVSTRVQVPSGQNFDSLERSLTRIHNRLNTADKELGGTRVELLRLRDDARSNYRAAAARRKYTDKICRTLKNSRRQRIERWQLFRKLITVRSKTQFMYLLTNRSFRGNIKMDHREKTLDIQVEPDITKSSDKGRQTKTLSGGEKSYSTICLLLALWDAMGSPIRCLDEFDVFMDSVNRDVSMKMMIEAARQSISKQFILISPQSVNASHLGNDVSIIK